jgi:hypothetical protein
MSQQVLSHELFVNEESGSYMIMIRSEAFFRTSVARMQG